MAVINVGTLVDDLKQLVVDLQEEKQITTDARNMAVGRDYAYHSGEAVAFTSAIHMLKQVLRKYDV